MTNRALLQILFAAILLSLLAYTVWASTSTARLAMAGLARTDPPLDHRDAHRRVLRLPSLSSSGCASRNAGCCRAYCGSVAIMALGNMAMASYVLWQLHKLPPGAPASDILTSRSEPAR